MKKIFFTSLLALIITGHSYSQSVTETTIRKFNIGVGFSTDIWQGLAPGMNARTINQGAQVFGMYNYRINESAIYFAGGIGVSTHNLYSNSYITDIKADSIDFRVIPDDINYKRTKLSLAYIDVPLEFRIKTKSQFRMAFGFKFGFIINSHTKYVGNRFDIDENGDAVALDGVNVKEKQKEVKQLETWRYGPTFRIGYKWFNATVYYQISKVFKVDKGPQLYPISVGIAVIPY
jgi:hypothetical protein